MRRPSGNLVWWLLLVLGGSYLAIRVGVGEPGMGKAYVRATPVEFAPVEVPAELGGAPKPRDSIHRGGFRLIVLDSRDGLVRRVRAEPLTPPPRP